MPYIIKTDANNRICISHKYTNDIILSNCQKVIYSEILMFLRQSEYNFQDYK